MEISTHCETVLLAKELAVDQQSVNLTLVSFYYTITYPIEENEI